MSTLSLSSALFVVAATAAGGGVAWLAASLHYRTKLALASAQLELAERAKQSAQELAVQSRQQVETLQQALSEAKRDGVIQNAAASARAEAAAAAAAKAAREKARAELVAQLDAADDGKHAAHGFADTQPASNFGKLRR
ncbi:MAG: hypothetical protein IT503_02490 [Burkholderiaceae bacterium]|nr:MAG: hypothetical protein F9K36_16435 [Burkholderiaceae bacterium]MCC7285026.1 hypothetical protein [Burkholderiaceae bacterium]